MAGCPLIYTDYGVSYSQLTRLAAYQQGLGRVKKYQLPYTRFDGVVPVAMEPVRDKIDGGHLLV